MLDTLVNHDVRNDDCGSSRALLTAAIAVVERAGSPEVTIEEIAAAAGVEPDAASALFPSVDELLVEAALQMSADDLQLATVAVPTVSAQARHYAKRRAFYRAMRLGPVSRLLDARMAQVIAPLISDQIRTLVGAHLTENALAALTGEVTAESFAVTNRWIVESDDSATAESLYVELEAIVVRRFDDVRRLQEGSSAGDH